ncbi:MAG: PLP-dependent aminotransferase family protein [Holophagaceae bacterium]
MSVPFYNLLFNLSLDPASEEPLYLQVASRVADVTRDGKLQPGAPMPGTRTLAKALGISRNAAIAAYGELHAQGWIETEVGFGTRVATVLPDFKGGPAPAKPAATGCGFEFASAFSGAAPAAPFRVDLREALPDPRLVPEEDLARAFRRPVAKATARPRPGRDPFGPLEARTALAGLLAERRALPADPEGLLLVGGTRDGLGLIARHLFPPGSTLAVEEPGDPRVWSAFHLAGHELVGVPVDAQGIVPETLEDICVASRPRALVLSPNAQKPTGAVLSPERRAAVLELAGRYRMALIEDDHAAELYFEDRDWRPLAAEDRRGVVLHVGSFEQLFGPAFPLGFITGPREPLATLARARLEEGGADLELLAGALRELILDGTCLRHARKVRTAVRVRRDRLAAFLREAFGEGLDVHVPASGLGLWATTRGLDLAALQRGAEALGIGLRVPGHWRLSPEGAEGLLFPFAAFTPEELESALGPLRRVAAGLRTRA